MRFNCRMIVSTPWKFLAMSIMYPRYENLSIWNKRTYLSICIKYVAFTTEQPKMFSHFSITIKCIKTLKIKTVTLSLIKVSKWAELPDSARPDTDHTSAALEHERREMSWLDCNTHRVIIYTVCLTPGLTLFFWRRFSDSCFAVFLKS